MWDKRTSLRRAKQYHCSQSQVKPAGCYFWYQPCISENLERKVETALGCSTGKEFNIRDERFTKPVEEWIAQRPKKLLLIFRKSGRVGISGR